VTTIASNGPQSSQPYQPSPTFVRTLV
jgi:hypothetical protein